MALRDVRILARTGLTVTADVYDAADVLLQSVAMVEIGTTGIYRADITVATGHWLHAHSAQGVFNAIARLAPAAVDLLRLGWSRVGSTLIFTDAATAAEVARFVIPAGTAGQDFADNLMRYLTQDVTVQLA